VKKRERGRKNYLECTLKNPATWGRNTVIQMAEFLGNCNLTLETCICIIFLKYMKLISWILGLPASKPERPYLSIGCHPAYDALFRQP
jgi:hypothetical protein